MQMVKQIKQSSKMVYLDVGIMDTMKDLFVNFIGAVVFSVFGYLYSRNDYQNLRSSRILFLKNQTIKHAKTREGAVTILLSLPPSFECMACH